MFKPTVFAAAISLAMSTVACAQQSKSLQVLVDFKVWDTDTGTFVKTDAPGYMFNPGSGTVLAIASFRGAPGALFSAQCGSVYVQLTTTAPDAGKWSTKLCPNATIGTFNSTGRIFVAFDLGPANNLCNSTNKIEVRAPGGRKSFDLSVDCGE